MTVELVIKKDSDPATIIYAEVLDRTAKITQENYFAKLGQWIRVYLKEHELSDNLDNFNLLHFLGYQTNIIATKRKNGDLTHSSLRQYKAVLNYAVACSTAVIENKLVITPPAQQVFWKRTATNMDYSRLHEIAKVLFDIGSETTPILRQLNQQAVGKNQTSTQKMKHIPDDILAIIQKDKVANRHLLRQFIKFNCIFGLRPMEWLFTNVVIDNRDGSDCKCRLIVKNGKNTHGRACGDARILHFKESQDFVEELIDFIQALKKTDKEHFTKSGINKLDQKHKTGGFDAPAATGEFEYEGVFGILQKQMYHLMRSNKCSVILRRIYNSKKNSYKYTQSKSKNKRGTTPPTLQFPTLYSTRHQAIANCKQAGYSDLEIAALFGHISTHTADKHYARKQYGKRSGSGVQLRPDEKNMAIIVANQRRLEALKNPEKLVSLDKEKTKQTVAKKKEPTRDGGSFGR